MIHIKCEANVSLFYGLDLRIIVTVAFHRQLLAPCIHFSANFQSVIFHVIDVPVIVSMTNNRDFECTKNCMLKWNFPHMRFH